MRRWVYLTADSQPLFAGQGSALWSHLSRECAIRRAAYVGASNGDDPAFYQLCEAALVRLGVAEVAWVRAEPDTPGRLALAGADLVVLSGGDAGRGWRAMERAALLGALAACHHRGAVLLGISAGAVQLGVAAPGSVVGLGLLPWIVEAHAEAAGWPGLREAARGGAEQPGLGLGYGSAVVWGTGYLERLTGPVVELRGDAGAELQPLP